MKKKKRESDEEIEIGLDVFFGETFPYLIKGVRPLADLSGSIKLGII